MNVYVTKNYHEMSRKAANIISAQVILNPTSVLGLATGSSPLGTYKNLIEWHEQGDLDFANVTSVNLDEYKGLSADNDQSYQYFMNQNLFNHININHQNTHVPDGLADDPTAECQRYDDIIKASGGVDLQLLGMGLNGHIGFNEPSDSFAKTTNLVSLAESTIQANKRFFANEHDVPKQAYTMGIQTIMQARCILVIVSGAEKAEIVKKAFLGPITPAVPASILQLHNNVVLVGDEDALGLFKESFHDH